MSPLIHGYLYDKMNIEGKYDLYPIKDDVKAGLKELYDKGLSGLNVTVPHKSAVIPYLSGTDEIALSIGAVNTLIRKNDGFYGINTDIEGLKREVEDTGHSVKGMDTVILGAGGAARAAAFMCLREGASSITVFNRNIQKAEKIVEDMREYIRSYALKAQDYERSGVQPDVILKALPFSEVSNVTKNGSIAFQCTSVGLKPDYDSVITDDPAFYQKLKFAIDLVYVPKTTRFMQLCRENGAEAYNGLKMLIFQAVCAFEAWNDVEVPKDLVREVYEKVESTMRRNVILAGFMGSGKSSVGKRLSELLDYEYYDTDSMIVANEGKSINRIFEESGEAFFRKLEEELIEDIYKRSLEQKGKRFVLSVGGGAVLSEKNREYLKKTGLVIYLKASAGVIKKRLENDANRPLLKGDKASKIEELLKQREAVYEEAGDLIIDTDPDTVEEAALKGERRI